MRRYIRRCFDQFVAPTRILAAALVVTLGQPLALAAPLSEGPGPGSQGVVTKKGVGATQTEACESALSQAEVLATMGRRAATGVSPEGVISSPRGVVTEEKCQCEDLGQTAPWRWSCIAFVSWKLEMIPWPSGPSGGIQPPVQPVQPAGTNSQSRSTTTSEGRRPCNFGDGYQSVRLSDGAVYSGSFKNCRPLPGPAQYQQGSTTLNGNAEPIDDRTVKLTTANAVVTIALEMPGVNR
jgi:hypothetical protein